MELPKYNEIIIPALELLNSNSEIQLKDFEQPLAKHFQLAQEDIDREYDSGNGRIFYDRICWAISYLNMAGLIQKTRRGVYAINDIGRNQLKNSSTVLLFIQEQISKREETRVKKNTITNDTDFPNNNQTPEESLYEAIDGIKATVYGEILDTILNKSPREFEKLVVALLQKMGYGGEVHNSGMVTQYSNDKGIDGIIKEDVLGFGRIHIQAKRYDYSNTVGREEIQKFVGALAVAQSNKGIFITTSSFTKGAIEYVNNLNTSATVVLMDGKQLAEHIYNYGLGMHTEKVIEIKKLDGEFWDAMTDDK
jgi:restriction system protein